MDKYAVMDLIGEGSFGRVFRGKDKQTGETVALKLIPKVGHSDKDIHSLRSECKIQKELNHPNIVQLLDVVFAESGKLYLVFEYLDMARINILMEYQSEAI